MLCEGQSGWVEVVAVGCLLSRSGCDNNACLARWVVTQNEVPNNVARPVFGRPRLDSNIPICLAVALALRPVAMAFKLPALNLICNHGNHAAVLLPHRLHGQHQELMNRSGLKVGRHDKQRVCQYQTVRMAHVVRMLFQHSQSSNNIGKVALCQPRRMVRTCQNALKLVGTGPCPAMKNRPCL